MKRVLLEARHVSRYYNLPDGSTTTVLDDLTLEVREGEFVCLLGPSGSGKSTFLRILAGLVPPSKGEVLYRKSALNGVCRGVSMVFQSFALYPWLTVRENVELGLESMGMLADDRRRKAERAIDMVGLDGFEEAYPKELSGGMRQRVGIARALVVEPDVLMMDEPFSALDVLTAENLRRDLLELWMDSKIPTRAVIMVTHGIEEAVYLADRVVVLGRDPGRIVADMQIDLPHWRDRDSAEFKKVVDKVYGILTKRPTTGTVAKQAKPKETVLPAIRAGAMTGLMEILEDAPERVDLYQLGEELQFDVEDLLPIVEAVELLGFGRVAEGDLELTEMGRRFAQATVLERKDIFRQQVQQHVPSLGRILAVLRSKTNHRMTREFFLDVLEERMGKERASQQLDTLIDWGRYAEVLEYDEGRHIVSLPVEA